MNKRNDIKYLNRERLYINKNNAGFLRTQYLLCTPCTTFSTLSQAAFQHAAAITILPVPVCVLTLCTPLSNCSQT
jgi:hypothetical protein